MFKIQLIAAAATLALTACAAQPQQQQPAQQRPTVQVQPTASGPKATPQRDADHLGRERVLVHSSATKRMSCLLHLKLPFATCAL